jgi:hypothetical protein
MKRAIPILILFLSLLIINPAMAVKVTTREDRPPQKQVSHSIETPSQSAESTKVQPRESEPPHKKQSSPPERRIKEDDNFIDENGDGINDRLQRPPEVIKKKETKKERSIDRPAQRPSEQKRDNNPEKE